MKKFFIASLLLFNLLFFVGCSSDDNANTNEPDKITSASTSTTEKESHIEGTLPETADEKKLPPVTGNTELDSKVAEISSHYDELIERAKGYSNNPDSFTADARTKYIQDLDTLTTSFTEISEQLNLLASENTDPSPYIEVLNYLQNKSDELLKSAD